MKWHTDSPIGSPANLVRLLDLLRAKAEREGIPFEVCDGKSRRKCAERWAREEEGAS